MTDIVNFVPLSGSVTVRGTTFKVRGLEFEELGQLIYRFPQVLEAWKGGKLNMPSLVSAPALIAAAIACAIDKAGDAPAEKSFANLALGERAAFLSKILELTAPDGIGPFVDLLRAAAPAPQQLLQPENPAAGKKQDPREALVEAADYLIGAGYGRAAVLHMTPREIMGAFDAAQARRRDQAAERLSIAALGAQGKAASIQKEIDKLSQD